MKLSNKTYDSLKIVTVVLSAIGTMYFALCGIWNLPYGEQVVGTITAVNTAILGCINYSSAQYAKEMQNGETE